SLVRGGGFGKPVLLEQRVAEQGVSVRVAGRQLDGGAELTNGAVEITLPQTHVAGRFVDALGLAATRRRQDRRGQPYPARQPWRAHPKRGTRDGRRPAQHDGPLAWTVGRGNGAAWYHAGVAGPQRGESSSGPNAQSSADALEQTLNELEKKIERVRAL